MNSIENLLRSISARFAEQRQAWALVGGLAVSVRTEPRFTRDLDIAVAVPGDQAAETLVYHLQQSGFRTFATVEHEETKRLATARLAISGSGYDGLVLDLLFASSGIEAEICMAAESMEVFPGLSIPVATIYHLIVLKVLARDDRTRPQDAADLRQLIAVANDDDIISAEKSAKLIRTRGFDRGRDLVMALNDALNEFRA